MASGSPKRPGPTGRPGRRVKIDIMATTLSLQETTGQDSDY